MPEEVTARRRRRLRWWIAAPLLLLAVLLTAVVAVVGLVFVQGRATPDGDGEYVALGSSFAAGPGITGRADGSPWLCGRSRDNYPHFVAEATGLSLSDMTCSGAVTADVLRGGLYFQGPQLRAVTPSTEVVTITIGGNDVHYLGNLFAWACARNPDAVPVAYKAAGVCEVEPARDVDDAFADLPEQLTEIITEVRATAPSAQVVLVDYVTVLPPQGTCPALPISDMEADRARAVADRLAQITADVARRTGADLVRASELSQGHDVCSSDPWVSGWTWSSNPLAHGVLPFHPREAAMVEISEAVQAVIR